MAYAISALLETPIDQSQLDASGGAANSENVNPNRANQ